MSDHDHEFGEHCSACLETASDHIRALEADLAATEMQLQHWLNWAAYPDDYFRPDQPPGGRESGRSAELRVGERTPAPTAANLPGFCPCPDCGLSVDHPQSTDTVNPPGPRQYARLRAYPKTQECGT